MSQNLPVILIEVLLIFGGVLAFGWWQLRDVRKSQEQTAIDRSRRQKAEADADKERSDAAI
jgi:predicted negative regulator of RcsB-dependent stress response